MPVKLLSQTTIKTPFEDQDIKCEIANVIVRCVKDRGQVFFEFGSKYYPNYMFGLSDVLISLNKEDLNTIKKNDFSVNLTDLLRIITENFKEISKLFSEENALISIQAMSSAQKSREKEFMNHLKNNAQKHKQTLS